MLNERPPYEPLSNGELFARFEMPHGTSKHLLILYSLVVGTNARVIVDLGLGQTTGALRAAAAKTGGVVHTCDFDKRRWRHLESAQDVRWKLYLEPVGDCLRRIDAPIDFVMHDAAHNYHDVRRDLELVLPKMRRFGMICVHDTQHADLYRDMLGAIRDATRRYRVSVTNLPFYSGLAIVRVEESEYPPLPPCPDEKGKTLAAPYATVYDGEGHSTEKLSQASLGTRLWAHRIRAVHRLKQLGLVPRGWGRRLRGARSNSHA